MTDPITLEALSELEDQSAELDRCHAGKDGTRFYEAQQALMARLLNEHRALIASANRLAELESALTFLLGARDPGYDFNGRSGAEIELRCAKMMGWTSPLRASEEK